MRVATNFVIWVYYDDKGHPLPEPEFTIDQYPLEVGEVTQTYPGQYRFFLRGFAVDMGPEKNPPMMLAVASSTEETGDALSYDVFIEPNHIFRATLNGPDQRGLSNVSVHYEVVEKEGVDDVDPQYMQYLFRKWYTEGDVASVEKGMDRSVVREVRVPMKGSSSLGVNIAPGSEMGKALLEALEDDTTTEGDTAAEEEEEDIEEFEVEIGDEGEGEGEGIPSAWYRFKGMLHTFLF